MLDRLQRLGHHLKRPRNFQDSCLGSPPIPRGGGGYCAFVTVFARFACTEQFVLRVSVGFTGPFREVSGGAALFHGGLLRSGRHPGGQDPASPSFAGSPADLALIQVL
jgi:hypothetical protein